MRLIILEGSRGVGKSTISSKIRQNISEITLINPTGFHLDGEEGLQKIREYYLSWFHILSRLSKHDSTFVFDRFYFSEMVFSKLYKNYNFINEFNSFNIIMEYLSRKGVKIDIFFLTINDKRELTNRLNREKVAFGSAEESVEQTLLQQSMYENVFNNFSQNYLTDNLKLHNVKTDGKMIDEIYEEIVSCAML